MKNTKIINLFGSSGSTKSTCAYGITYLLKKQGLSAEYVHEYAKNKAWLKDTKTLKHQPYVESKQNYLQNLASGQVDYIVCDSPTILADFYGEVYENPLCIPEWKAYVWASFKLRNNINFFIKRNPEFLFETVGRNQTSEESLQHQELMEEWLKRNNVSYMEIEASNNSVDEILEIIKNDN